VIYGPPDPRRHRDIWGERTPHEGSWPVRVDERVLEEPDNWDTERRRRPADAAAQPGPDRLPPGRGAGPAFDRFLNATCGHLAALPLGFFCVWLFSANDSPRVLASGDVIWERVGAATLAIGLTMLALGLLHSWHLPATATALLVALGALHTGHQAAWLAIGALLLGAVGEVLRHVRMGDMKSWARRPVSLPSLSFGGAPAPAGVEEMRRARG
jgi:hypothetical protein